MKTVVLCAIILMLLTPASILAFDNSLWASSICEESKIVIEPSDDIPPVSTLDSSPTFLIHLKDEEQLEIHVEWGGIDDPNGGGIAGYDVQYKMNYIGTEIHIQSLPEWQDWYINTDETVDHLNASTDYIYFFRVRAIDNFGNVEPWPATWDSFTVVKSVPAETYSKLVELLMDDDEDEVDDDDKCDDENCDDGARRPNRPIRPQPNQEDDLSPVSRVKPLFPVHFCIPPCYEIQAEDLITIQVYPYPPSHYVKAWLERHGIISQTTGQPNFMVTWLGYDGPNGSGVKAYDVQFRYPEIIYTYPSQDLDDNPHGGSPVRINWDDWQRNITESQARFFAPTTGLYQFRCRAWDNAENAEDYPITADTQVFVLDLRYSSYQ